MTTIYESLKSDHQKIQSLMDAIVETGEDEETKRNRLFNELKEALLVHAKAEEKIFYSQAEKVNSVHDEIEDGEKEHHKAEKLLDELTKSRAAGADWISKFGQLKALIEHHVYEEEEEVFPKLKETWNKEKAENLAEAMDEAREQVTARIERNMTERKAA